MLLAKHVIELVAGVSPHVERDRQALCRRLAAKGLHEFIFDDFNASDFAGHRLILFAVVVHIQAKESGRSRSTAHTRRGFCKIFPLFNRDADARLQDEKQHHNDRDRRGVDVELDAFPDAVADHRFDRALGSAGHFYVFGMV